MQRILGLALALVASGCFTAHHSYAGSKLMTSDPDIQGVKLHRVSHFEAHDRQFFWIHGAFPVGEDLNGAALAARQIGNHDGAVNLRIRDGQDLTGVWMEKAFADYTRADWDLTLATNLTALFDVTQVLLPALLASGDARVINIAAIDGEVGFAKLVAQCAAKFGAVGFTRALAKELWDKPITVNAICPAAVDKQVGFEVTPARAPAPAVALPWDVARAVVYLASQDGVRVTGSCLDVHGVGFLAS